MKQEALNAAYLFENCRNTEPELLKKAADIIKQLVAKIEVTERDYNFMKDYAISLELVEKELKAQLKKASEK